MKGARSALDLQLEVNQLRAKLAEYERPARGPLLLWKHWECLRPLLLVDVRKRNCYRYKVKPRKVRVLVSAHCLAAMHSRGYSMTRLHHSIIIVNATPRRSESRRWGLTVPHPLTCRASARATPPGVALVILRNP